MSYNYQAYHTCFDALYMCFTKGRRLMIHSPSASIQLPNHELKKTPVMVMNNCTQIAGHSNIQPPDCHVRQGQKLQVLSSLSTT